MRLPRAPQLKNSPSYYKFENGILKKLFLGKHLLKLWETFLEQKTCIPASFYLREWCTQAREQSLLLKPASDYTDLTNATGHTTVYQTGSFFSIRFSTLYPSDYITVSQTGFFSNQVFNPICQWLYDCLTDKVFSFFFFLQSCPD